MWNGKIRKLRIRNSACLVTSQNPVRHLRGLNVAMNLTWLFLNGKASKAGHAHWMPFLCFHCRAQTLPASSNARTRLAYVPQVMQSLCESGQLANNICTNEKLKQLEYKVLLDKNEGYRFFFFFVTAAAGLAIQEVCCCWTLKAQKGVIKESLLCSIFVKMSLTAF